MTAERHALAEAWRLPADSRVRLARLSLRHFEACQDIDHALGLLLRDPRLVRAWLGRRHVQLFHARPLQVVLGSADGCRQVRRLLLAELAAADLPGDIAAIAMNAPP